jgi:hypothetical protein
MKPKWIAADMAYGINRFLGWLVKQRIVPRIPVWNKSECKDGTFSAPISTLTDRTFVAQRARRADDHRECPQSAFSEIVAAEPAVGD